MTIYCLVSSSDNMQQALPAVVEAQTIRYDCNITGAIITCADGSRLAKYMSSDFYTSDVMANIHGDVREDCNSVDLESAGRWLHVPAGESETIFIRTNLQAFIQTASAWDSVSSGPSGSSSPSASRLSTMSLV